MGCGPRHLKPFTPMRHRDRREVNDEAGRRWCGRPPFVVE